MGFALSVLYFVTYYVTPAVIFGPLAAFHVQVILAVLVVLASLPSVNRAYLFKTPQSLALVGLMIAALLSVLVAMRWLGGAVAAFQLFIPNAFGYYLVVLHCNSKKRLQFL